MEGTSFHNAYTQKREMIIWNI